MRSNKSRVCYLQNNQIGKYCYSKDHPMKPKRIAMTHSLINSFSLYKELDVYLSREADDSQIKQFHNAQYSQYLRNFVDPDIQEKLAAWNYGSCLVTEEDRQQSISCSKNQLKFNIREGTDCPPFAGLYNFCKISAGASIDCAHALISNLADVAINWGGGLHHAKKCQASGFCYVNDIVLCVLQLLKQYPRVVYIDIDVHHGDGVQEAFFLTNRVMTKQFFPGTGNLDSVGMGLGKFYAVNVPLKPGITDDIYFQLFKKVMDRVFAFFKPNAVVIQLGADSLANDRLGHFNLTVRGHGNCLNHILKYNLPTVMLGGGGYTVANVARCWVYQTGIALNKEIDGMIPKSDQFYQMYEPDFRLHFPTKNVQNKNTTEQLDKILSTVVQNLRHLQFAPGVQLHDVPIQFLQFEKPSVISKRTSMLC